MYICIYLYINFISSLVILMFANCLFLIMVLLNNLNDAIFTCRLIKFMAIELL